MRWALDTNVLKKGTKEQMEEEGRPRSEPQPNTQQP